MQPEFLDQLTVVGSQGTGVDIDISHSDDREVSRRAGIAAGGDMERSRLRRLSAAADEFGPSGLRGAMSEIHAGGGQGPNPDRGPLSKSSLATRPAPSSERTRRARRGAIRCARRRTRLWLPLVPTETWLARLGQRCPRSHWLDQEWSL